jgi:exopolyphosphatase/pppGpp-phosphohydrolase
MRLAAIDIGTNSLHMIVVRVRPDLSFEVIDRETEARLAAKKARDALIDRKKILSGAGLPGKLMISAARRTASR